MPATRTAPASNLPSCIVVVTIDETNTVTDVDCFGDDQARAVAYARARTEDGDGTYRFQVKRVYGERAATIRVMSHAAGRARTYESRKLLSNALIAAYVEGANR